MTFPHEINIVQAQTTMDNAGGTEAGFNLYWNTHAEIRQVYNTYRDGKAPIENRVVKRFTFRYRPDKDISTDMFIDYNGQRYTILSVEQKKEQLHYFIVIGTATYDNWRGNSN